MGKWQAYLYTEEGVGEETERNMEGAVSWETAELGRGAWLPQRQEDAREDRWDPKAFWIGTEGHMLRLLLT